MIASILVFVIALSDAKAMSDFAYSDEWLAIGHYQSKGKGYKSTIDTPNFFLSEDGEVNPKNELDATIALFSSGDDEKKCLFPARYKLLRKKGQIKQNFPKCEELEKFYDDLRPAGVTFLFTDAYMNSPSSLFGHTLLRIDTARKGTQLLAHGANYGAFTGDNPGALYPILGIVGGYYGGFTVKPYYDIINTYNNIENRDIWEFELNFNKEELDFFVAHLWEVGQTQSRYYFFTRNCSYMLMETLDAVRPSLKLAQKFAVQTIPLDTVKAVYNSDGLVKNVNYRPSRQNKIKKLYGQMSDNEKEAFLRAIKKQDYNMESLDEKEQSRVAEAAYQYVQYKYVAKDLELKDYRKQSFGLLKLRSKLKNAENDSYSFAEQKTFEAHDAMRLAWGAGFRNENAFQEIAYRPAYHSLTDDNYGFLRGAEINFLNTTVRHYDKEDKYVLQKFELLGIRSIAPIDALFAPMSFQILADVNREVNPANEKEGYVANLVVGGGATYALNDNVWVFALMNNYLAYGGFLPRNQWGGLGGQIGMLIDLRDWRTLIEAEKVYASAKIASKTVYKAEAVYSITRNWAMAVHYKYQQNYGQDIDEIYLGFRNYF